MTLYEIYKKLDELGSVLRLCCRNSETRKGRKKVSSKPN